MELNSLRSSLLGYVGVVSSPNPSMTQTQPDSSLDSPCEIMPPQIWVACIHGALPLVVVDGTDALRNNDSS